MKLAKIKRGHSMIVKWCSHIRKQFGTLQNVKHGGTMSCNPSPWYIQQ